MSETLGLDWPDLDLGDRPQLRVRAQRYRSPDRAALKSSFARREIPLTQAMADALRELRPDDPRAAQGPVFADRRGRPLRYSTVFNRVWAPRPHGGRAGLGGAPCAAAHVREPPHRRGPLAGPDRGVAGAPLAGVLDGGLRPPHGRRRRRGSAPDPARHRGVGSLAASLVAASLPPSGQAWARLRQSQATSSGLRAYRFREGMVRRDVAHRDGAPAAAAVRARRRRRAARHPLARGRHALALLGPALPGRGAGLD